MSSKKWNMHAQREIVPYVCVLGLDICDDEIHE